MKIYIDGTWIKASNNSNVYKMYKEDGYENDKYFSGPGTVSNSLFSRFPGILTLANKYLGGIFGYGTTRLVDRAYNIIVENRKVFGASPIDLFGFSRGSAAVRMLAGRLAEDGIQVRFLGCYDTVGAFGIPISVPPFTFFGLDFQKINLFHDMKVHKNVLHAAHARSLNEDRPAFATTPMEPRNNISEKWFRGDHWKIGSSPLTLKYMKEQYSKARIKCYTEKVIKIQESKK